MKKSVSAIAHSNIALVKYWGKRDQKLNLPAVGSISVTLEALKTQTTVTLTPEASADELFLAGKRADKAKEKRVSHFLDLIRESANQNAHARIESVNNFPTGAGLASSASAFAALALAGSAAYDLRLTSEQLSVLARQGSGSAARSLYGGFVEMKMGDRDDGSDAFAVPLADQHYWDIRILIAITTEEEKKTGSGPGMNTSAVTSPYYNAWLAASAHNLKDMRNAIRDKDFQKLGELSEHSCLKMHAVMLSSVPALIYWNDITMKIIHMVYKMRQHGIQVYFTIDAGPQVKLLTLPKHQDIILGGLRSITGIRRVITSQLGPDACLET